MTEVIQFQEIANGCILDLTNRTNIEKFTTYPNNNNQNCVKVKVEMGDVGRTELMLSELDYHTEQVCYDNDLKYTIETVGPGEFSIIFEPK